jgi:TolA-binding protein
VAKRGTVLILATAALAAAALTGLAQPTSRPASAPPKGSDDKAAAATSDIEMVERLIAARKQYRTSLEDLRQFYLRTNDLERAKWAEDELKNFHRLVKHAYRLDLDVPVPTLQPKQNIPEANELFRRALSFKEKGFGTDYIDNQRRSEILFQQMLDKYPECDKIGEAAYQLGDLYEKYRPTPQHRRSAAYFERSFQWNKSGQSDARLRAARIYDTKLADRNRAVELYKEVIDHDTDTSRIQEAQRRLAELTGKR